MDWPPKGYEIVDGNDDIAFPTLNRKERSLFNKVRSLFPKGDLSKRDSERMAHILDVFELRGPIVKEDACHST